MTNPYESPEAIGADCRRKWSLHGKLFVSAVVAIALSFACLVIGYQHYRYLAEGFDYRSQDSRELARLTEPVKYWFIPIAAFLPTSIVLFFVAATRFLFVLFRRRSNQELDPQ